MKFLVIKGEDKYIIDEDDFESALWYCCKDYEALSSVDAIIKLPEEEQ